MKPIALLFVIMTSISINAQSVDLGRYVHHSVALNSFSVDYSEFKYIKSITLGAEYINTYWADAYLHIEYVPKVTYFTTHNGEEYNFLDLLANGTSRITGTVTAYWRIPNSHETITHTTSVNAEFGKAHSEIVSGIVFPDNPKYFKISCEKIKASGGVCSREELQRRGFAPELIDLKFKVKVQSTELVEKHIENLRTRRQLIEQGTVLYASNKCEEAIATFEEALTTVTEPWIIKNLKLDNTNIQFKIDDCKGKIKASENTQNIKDETNDLVAKQEEALDNPEKAETNLQNNTQEDNVQEEVVLDYWGNPVKKSTTNSNNTTTTYGNLTVEDNSHYQNQMQIRERTAYAKATHEQNELAKRAQVDRYNANIAAQANEIYQNSLTLESELENAKQQLNFASGDALLKSSATLASNATNIADAKMGLAGMGVGLLMKIGENAAKKKAAEEARLKRERLREAEEARIKAVKEAMKNTRLKVFSNFPEGELPLSSTKSNGNNLYYFVYTYNDSQLTEQTPSVTVIPVFAIGKYPDQTWPLQTKIEADLKTLIPNNKTICGPFYTLQEAQQVFSSFSNLLSKTNMQQKVLEYKGFNVHDENQTNTNTQTQLDFWGNPIKN